MALFNQNKTDNPPFNWLPAKKEKEKYYPLVEDIDDVNYLRAFPGNIVKEENDTEGIFRDNRILLEQNKWKEYWNSQKIKDRYIALGGDPISWKKNIDRLNEVKTHYDSSELMNVPGYYHPGFYDTSPGFVRIKYPVNGNTKDFGMLMAHEYGGHAATKAGWEHPYKMDSLLTSLVKPKKYIEEHLKEKLVNDYDGYFMNFNDLYSYFTRPTEIHARMKEMQELSNKTKGETLTYKDYRKWESKTNDPLKHFVDRPNVHKVANKLPFMVSPMIR